MKTKANRVIVVDQETRQRIRDLSERTGLPMHRVARLAIEKFDSRGLEQETRPMIEALDESNRGK